MTVSLTDAQIDSLTQTLKARHKVLTELIHIELVNSTDQAHVELAGLVHDTKDESMASALRSVEMQVVQMHLAELDDIDQAQQRVRMGTYGQCGACQTDIGFERLIAYPTAKRCVNCQRAHEEKARKVQS